ncbi:MAG: peptidyl-prolyl cis-trans isomerase [Fibromonadales bacterium]|nr:peptidyl-prolyl cis-trans isomerase [Fibromonadales bacterium]
MRSISTIFVIAVSLFALIGCSSAPQDKTIAKIGNTSLFTSDAEFLASIKPEAYRDKKSIAADLQQTAETRRTAEVARLMFAAEQNSVQKNLAEEENSRLAQIYSYFYLQANLGHVNKALLDFYKKNKNRYADSSTLSVDMPLVIFREKLAADLFLSETPTLAAVVNDSNKTDIIDSCRRAIANSELDRLKKAYNVELVKIEPPGAEEYYKANPDEFQTKAQYKLLSLSNSDSAVLASKIKGISTRDEFAKIATELPLSKQGHAIMGIGMFPSLDGEISNLGAKKFTSILRAPDTQIYYVFYIDSIIPPQLKPWDRAKNLTKSILEGKGDFPLDSSVVLATMGGKPFITEKEVLELQSKIPFQRRAYFRREVALNNLLEKNLYAKAAKEKGLDKSYEYIAWTRQLTDQAYARILMDSLLTNTLGIPEDSLKAAYEAEKDSLFLPKSYEDSKLDIAVWLRVPDMSYKREFALNKQYYPQADNWESIKRTLYKNIRYREFSGIQERELANLHKSVPVAIMDTTWGLEFTASNFAELVAQAKIQYDSRDLQKAKSLWEKVRVLFPQNDSAQKTASYELANIYQELGSYSASINEYKAITELWANDPDVYKAYFMQGFVLSEYEKKDSLALLAFEELLKRFPNSELSGDAKIMVDNIKSGGKVFEDLIKKIENSPEE